MSSVVFPMPGSPETTTAAPRPSAAASQTATIEASSRSRPTSIAGQVSHGTDLFPCASPRRPAALCQHARMPTYLHTMVRITDPERSRAFYEALGFTFSREMDIVRNGEREATNYFYSLGSSENVLELTFNHDGRSYELGTGYGHIAIAVDDLAETLERLKGQGIEAEREPYRVSEGGSLICFVRDPDEYRVELIDRSGK